MTFDEAAQAVTLAEQDPRAFFGENPKSRFRELVRVVHPDMFVEDSEEQKAARRLFERLQVAFAVLDSAPQILVAEDGREYTKLSQLATGSLCDVVLCRPADSTVAVVLKIPRVASAKADRLLAKEHEIIQRMREASKGRLLQRYFPPFQCAFRQTGQPHGLVGVFEYASPRHTAVQIQQAYPQGVGGRHLAWMFNRLLAVLRACHEQDYVHGAVTPDHLLFEVANHGLQLWGWIHAVKIGQRLVVVPAAFKSWYPDEARTAASPATDLYMAAKCMQYLGGWDETTQRWPDSVPLLLQGFFRGCLLSSVNMRRSDLTAVRLDFAEVLREVYGKPSFVDLPMPAGA